MQSRTIPNQVRQRMVNGESAVHVMSDFVAALEGELTQDLPESTDTLENSTHNNEATSPHVHFSKNPGEVYPLDSLTPDNPVQDTAAVEEEDKEWFTHHLSSYMSEGHTPYRTNIDEQDF